MTTLLVFITLLASVFSGLLVSSVSAQEAEKIPMACKTDPESEACQRCLDNPDDVVSEPCIRVVAGEQEEKPACDDSTDSNCCAGVKTSIITGALCQGKDDKEGGGVIFGLLKTVLKILTACIGIAAVGGIGYGALLYTTAENKPEQTKRAIEIIRNVVIGIIAYALMYVLLNFLIPGGVFI